MTREEAIRRIKSWNLNSDDMEVLSAAIPELTENEDDRIRKEIIDFIQWAEDRGMTRHDYHQAKRPAVWIAYLEKQKEQKEIPLMNGDGDLYFDNWNQQNHNPTKRQCFDEGIRYVQRLQKEQKQIKWTELTWKDIVELEGIINNVHYDFSAGIGQESFGKEVLERFRLTKGIEYLDEAEQKYWQKEQNPAE